MNISYSFHFNNGTTNIISILKNHRHPRGSNHAILQRSRTEIKETTLHPNVVREDRAEHDRRVIRAFCEKCRREKDAVVRSVFPFKTIVLPIESYLSDLTLFLFLDLNVDLDSLKLF